MSLERSVHLDLVTSVSQIRQSYEQQTKNETLNPARFRVLDILDIVVAFVESKPENLSEADLQTVCIAGYLYGIHNIAIEYFLDPRSRLHKLLLEVFKNFSLDQMSDLEKTIHFTKFYNIAFIKHQEFFSGYFAKKNINREILNKEIFNILQSNFSLVKNDTQQLMKSLPPESFISHKMKTLFFNYIKLSHEKGYAIDDSDIQYIKMIAAVNKFLLQQEKINDRSVTMSRSKRIRMLVLLNVMQSIWNTYYYNSPKDRNVLYDLCCEALNIDKVEEIKSEIRLNCYSMFDWLQKNKSKFEKIANEDLDLKAVIENFNLTYQPDQIQFNNLFTTLKPFYVDALLLSMSELNVKMLQTVTPQSQSSHTKLLLHAGIAGAVCVAIPTSFLTGGIGDVIGKFFSKTDLVNLPKVQVSNLTNYAITLVLGQEASGYIGHFIGDQIIEESMKYMFEKVFAALGIIVGAAAGGIVTLAITEVSYQSLRCLYDLCMYLNKRVALNEDQKEELVKCLLDLPEEIFSKEKKEKVTYLTTPSNFFTKEITKENTREVTRKNTSDTDKKISGQDAAAVLQTSPAKGRRLG